MSEQLGKRCQVKCVLVETGSCVSASTAQTGFLVRLVFGQDHGCALWLGIPGATDSAWVQVTSLNLHVLKLGANPPITGLYLELEQDCFEDSHYLRIQCSTASPRNTCICSFARTC